MSANKKVILIVVLGAGACLLGFFISQYFAKRTHADQVLLVRIQSMAPRIEQIRLLSENFVREGDAVYWRGIVWDMASLETALLSGTRANRHWARELRDLKAGIQDYRKFLDRIHEPALRIKTEKDRLKGLGLSFSEEIRTRIIEPYRKEEALGLYQGRHVDPIKTRIKETAYDVMMLHLQQQLILLELTTDWDLPGYRRKKETIARAVEKRRLQLNYLAVLMGNDTGIGPVIAAFGEQMDDLLRHEAIIVGTYEKLTWLNAGLIAAGDHLLTAGEKLNGKIVADIAAANRLDRFLSWGGLIAILGALGVLGAMLAGDIIRFVQDIEKSREALRENEELLDLALDSANEGIWDWHLNSNRVSFDSRYYTIAGYEPDEFPGALEEWEKRVHPDDIRQARQTVERYLAGESNAYDVEFRFLCKDGTYMWIQGRGKIVARNEQGDPVRFVGTHADINQRKKDEEELRQLRNYLSNIIDSMPSVLVAVDGEGNVTQWNHRTEQTTGLSFEEARAQPLARVFPRLADEMGRIQKAIRERRVVSAPKVSSRRENETRFEDITIFPLAANGVEGAVIRVDDVTERVRLEEMMIQSEKMLSVGGLAAGMAHEINNPLAGMMQTAEVLAQRLGAGLDLPANRNAAEAAGTTIAAVGRFMEARGIPRMLATINDSGRRVAAIVDNMLSFARKSDATVSSHVLGDLLDKTVELAATDYDLKKQFDFKRIEIRREYADPPVSAPCEGAKIQQVLLNILRNGAEAMQEAGTQAPRFIFRTRVDHDTNMAIMEIEDNGPGMDEQTRKRIFEPFFTSKPVGVGTGLGLSVSYFIITENHRGEMAVESRPGAGARFIIHLPVKGGRVE